MRDNRGQIGGGGLGRRKYFLTRGPKFLSASLMGGYPHFQFIFGWIARGKLRAKGQGKSRVNSHFVLFVFFCDRESLVSLSK